MKMPMIAPASAAANIPSQSSKRIVYHSIHIVGGLAHPRIHAKTACPTPNRAIDVDRASL
jgi:hypothetical protein